MRTRAPWAALAAWLALAASPAGAEDAGSRMRVWFQGGRSVVAASIEPVDEAGTLTRVALAGGGTITVPTSLVRRLADLPPEPPEAARPDPAESAEPGDVPDPCDPLASPRLTRWGPFVEAAATRHGLDLNLVRAIIAVESCGKATAVSPAGAVGLMQLMPATAGDYGCTDPADPAKNIEAGCLHLARLQGKLGSLDLVLAAYNAGEGAVARWGGVPRYAETLRYVRLVRAHLERLAAASDEEATAG